MNLTDLQPKEVWKAFYSLTQIPRPSGKRKEISDFIANYGRELGLETVVDEIGNVIIRKPASAGYEDHPGVILQGHMDMVPQKNSDKVFDFEKDPIEAYVDGEWVRANGTTRPFSLRVLPREDLERGEETGDKISFDFLCAGTIGEE